MKWLLVRLKDNKVLYSGSLKSLFKLCKKYKKDSIKITPHFETDTIVFVMR